MSTTSPVPKVRLFRLLGDATALLSGLAILVASIHNPTLLDAGLGVGLISLSVPHLEDDLNLSGS
jgi:hypothetical protein